MSLSPEQRQTMRAREKFLSQFDSDDARREHMGDLARRSAASRLTLLADEREALAAAYRLLEHIYRRHVHKLDFDCGERGRDR